MFPASAPIHIIIVAYKRVAGSVNFFGSFFSFVEVQRVVVSTT